MAEAERTRKKGRQRATALLTEDHKSVKKLFKDFEKLKKDEAGDEEMEALVHQICTELSVHAQIEEELFYPALREAMDEQDLLDEAFEEHASAKILIADLKTMKPSDARYDAKVMVLSEYVQHHIKEEQGEIFPEAKKAGVDTAELGEQLMERKVQLMGNPDLLEEAAMGADQRRRAATGAHAHR